MQGLLTEAYNHYFEHDEDGHCKSQEGAITFEYPNYFQIRHEGQDPLRPMSISVYSYALGPNRWHTFSSTSDALKAVRNWYIAEMEHDYDKEIE